MTFHRGCFGIFINGGKVVVKIKKNFAIMLNIE